MGIFVLLPFVFIGALFLLMSFRQSAALLPIAIAAWPAVFWYNRWILSRCPGDCGIRIDLVIIAPVLLLATYLALKEAWRRRK